MGVDFDGQPDPAGAAAWCFQQHTSRYGSAPEPGGGHNDWLVRFVNFCNTKGAPLQDVLDLALQSAPEGHNQRKIIVTVNGIYQRQRAQYAIRPYVAASTAIHLAGRISTNQRMPVAPRPESIIPGEIAKASLQRYEHNMLARMLRGHFGYGVAEDLITRFRLGTSTYWPGACVFWLFDEQDRVRGGQVVQYDEAGHTIKFERPDGDRDRRARPVHTALLAAYRRQNVAVPAWLSNYAAPEVPKSPCLFGLPQLVSASKQQPVALVESAKTAILATPYAPQYVWLATMGLGMLTEERLLPLKKRRIVLFPDAGAYQRWSKRADELRRKGFDVTISVELEQCVEDDEKRNGLDVADVLMNEWPGYPPNWDDTEL